MSLWFGNLTDLTLVESLYFLLDGNVITTEEKNKYLNDDHNKPGKFNDFGSELAEYSRALWKSTLQAVKL
ncbi:hypothetical protein BCON_0369g00020 [Botryotinia convoluta]|uniref:Uncharacterized protein n=1 Tax=Botryotinia convoluta TaxID=54673 RepID=A0A4Z1H9B3_9HELO|nr:hypothetical protein BCON_0369g00020 [Botryotinia convoluta]